MVFAIQLFDQAAKRVFNKLACFTFFKQLSKRGKLGFFLFQQTEPRPDNFTSRGITAIFKLFGNKGIEVLAKGNTGVFNSLGKTSKSTNNWYYSQP